jgi:pimeloyl-ACP methyl ester carboxylesterase
MRGDTGDELPDALTMITESQCPIGIIYGQNSRILTAESATILKDLVGEDLIQCVPDSHHHVFLDQPLAFIDTLRNLLPKLQTSLAENQNGPS